MPTPETPILMLVLSITVWLLVVIITLLILWAIIRGAVLSALRKHHREVRAEAGAQTGRFSTLP